MKRDSFKLPVDRLCWIEMFYLVARSRMTHFKFEYCASAIACRGWREGER